MSSVHKPTNVSSVDGRIAEQVAAIQDHDQSGNIILSVQPRQLRPTIASLANLDTSIYLFREVLIRRPFQHPLRPNVLRGLANALLMRFDCTGRPDDLDEGLQLHNEAGLREDDSVSARETSNPCRIDGNCAHESIESGDEELSEMTELAVVTFKQFKQSAWLLGFNNTSSLEADALHFEIDSASHPSNTIDDHATGSGATTFRTRLLRDLNDAILSHRAIIRLLPAPRLDGSSAFLDLSAALITRFILTGQSSDLQDAITFRCESLSILLSGEISRTSFDVEGTISLCRRILSLMPESHPDRWFSLHTLAMILVQRFHRTASLAGLDEAVVLGHQALGILPALRPNHSAVFNGLAAAYRHRFDTTHLPADLDRAIALHRKALELLSTSDSARPFTLENLASCLRLRFLKTEQLPDLEEAIALHREVLDLMPVDHHDRSHSFRCLGTALGSRFGLLGQLEDLDEGIILLRDSLALLPASHPDRAHSVSDLSTALSLRYRQTGRSTDVDEIVVLFNENRPASAPEELIVKALQLSRRMYEAASRLCELAGALDDKFLLSKEVSDLDQAITLYKEALKRFRNGDPIRFSVSNDLALALVMRFNETGQIADLNEAILTHRKLLSCRPVPHPKRSSSLNGLASALVLRSTQRDKSSDLEEAIRLHREALALRPAPHPDRSDSLSNLAVALKIQFRQTGDLSQLDQAVILHREALESRPKSHHHHHISLINLANILWMRFGWATQLPDMEEAIQLLRGALDILPTPHAARSTALNSLGIFLFARFNHFHERTDLKESIGLLREALELRPPSHPERSASLSNLSLVLEKSDLLEDQKEVAVVLDESLQLLPTTHPDRPTLLARFAMLKFGQFHQLKNLADLQEATMACREALPLFHPEHPSRCMTLSLLGQTLMAMHLHTKQSAHLGEAMMTFRSAAECEAASMHMRFMNAKLWASHADGCHESALEAYQTAIGLLPQLVMLGQDLRSRKQILLSETDGLAREAAACAIRSGQVNKAVEFLEEGRATFWLQALQLRTPLDELEGKEPKLANELRTIANALERGLMRDPT